MSLFSQKKHIFFVVANGEREELQLQSLLEIRAVQQFETTGKRVAYSLKESQVGCSAIMGQKAIMLQHSWQMLALHRIMIWSLLVSPMTDMQKHESISQVGKRCVI